MLGDKRFIQRLKIKNLLSFSEVGIDLELKSLNVLIGPNASGKSNLIETIGLLKSLPTDFAQGVRACGGISDLLWKGGQKTPVAEIDATVFYPTEYHPLRHRISFTKVGDRLELIDEAVEDAFPTKAGAEDVYFYYRFNRGRNPLINVKYARGLISVLDGKESREMLQLGDILSDQSILPQKKDSEYYPEITYLNLNYGKIKLFREWNMGRITPAREPQRTDDNGDFLNEDFGNLSLVLNDLEFRPEMKGKILEHLKIVYDRVKDIKTKTQMGQIQLYVDEGLDGMIPATRLSDGTLRYLCLLTILCHPSPPNLICIEEPELGLHPDILPEIAKLLIEASHRTQLVVTTHSPLLIDALGDVPEAVVVCENDEGGSAMKRLEKSELKTWLDEYRLGDVWMRGGLGGARW